MGRIVNLGEWNAERKKTNIEDSTVIRVQKTIDESIVFTAEELRETLKNMLTEELNMLAHDHTIQRKMELEGRINFKLKQIENSLINLVNERENSLINLVNERVDKITERIVTLTISRIVEEEVNKRLEIKLNKLKDSL
jgi:hypothetical protein